MKSYIVTDASQTAYEEMITTGALSDEDKILLRMMQGTAITGTQQCCTQWLTVMSV